MGIDTQPGDGGKPRQRDPPGRGAEIGKGILGIQTALA